MTKRFALAVCVAVVFMAAACGSQTRDKRHYETPELANVPVATFNETLPFDNFLLSDADAAQLQSDEATLFEKCMVLRGSSAKVVGDYIRPATGNLSWGGRFGTLGAAHAAQYGYQAGPDDNFSLGAGLYAKSLDNFSLPSSDLQAQASFYGKKSIAGAPGADKIDAPDVGCLEKVKTELHAPLVDPSRVEADVMNLVFNHPKVQAAMTRWAACMKKAGFAFGKVYDASVSFAGAPLTKRQTVVASADVSCTEASQWANLYYAALADYEKQAIDMQPSFFDSVLQSQKALQRSVATLLAKSSE